MEPDPRDDVLVADLRALGRSVRPGDDEPATPAARAASAASAASASLAAAVLDRLADAPPPRPASHWQRRRQRAIEALIRQWRRIVVAVLVVLLGGLGVPGVRAAVVDWFRFDGVTVRIEPVPSSSVTAAPPPPTARGRLSLEQARALVSFEPVVLTALGPPVGVEVSADRRLLSLTWSGPGGVTRLDEFDGALDYVFAKTASDAEWTSVGGTTALWFDRPHEVVILDAAGNRRTETARLAGHTLIWERAGTVLRLEGNFDQVRAIHLAGSAASPP